MCAPHACQPCVAEQPYTLRGLALDDPVRLESRPFEPVGTSANHDNVPIVASVARLASLDDAGSLAWRVYDGVGLALSDEEGRFAPACVDDLLAWLDQSLPEGPVPTPTRRPARAKGKQVWLF